MPQTGIGDYRVLSGGAAVNFWRLSPGTTAIGLMLDNSYRAATGDAASINRIRILPRLVVFDVVIRMSEPVVETRLTNAQSTGLLVTSVSGRPARTRMPMWEDGTGTSDSHVANICFAVLVPAGQAHFDGVLELRSRKNVARPGYKTVRLQIRGNLVETVNDLFVFFIATRRRRQPHRQEYCWTDCMIQEWSGGTGPPAPVSAAVVEAKVFRDQSVRGFRHRNRRVTLASNTGGELVYAHRPSRERKILAFPVEWPLIFTASRNGYVDRALLANLARSNVSHNKGPHHLHSIDMIPNGVAGARIATKKVLVDPGHGCVYAYTGARRSQEWYVAHRIGTRVRGILQTRFRFPAANFFMTRTAGFGLINPAQVNQGNAPERGMRDFRFDVPGRRVRIRRNALGLVDLSNLVLTGNNNRPATITTASRDQLLAINNATITTVLGAMRLPVGQQVEAGSAHWDAARSDYVCRIVRTAPRPGQARVVNNARHISITTAHWFTLNAAMLTNLARRSARWSIAHELGGNPGANPATGRPAFTAGARAAMRGAGAENYMVNQIIAELALEEPQAAGRPAPRGYRNRESMGWSPVVKRDYINRKNCDVAVSIHENAGALNSVGLVMLVGRNRVSSHVRTAKIMMKYADPLDQGYRSGGVFEIRRVVAQLWPRNRVRHKYGYYELEFMNSTIQANPGVRVADTSRYQYNLMVQNNFINTAAKQIVAAIIEFLLDPQSDIDRVRYSGSNLPTW